jgi:hypothetical protein
LAKETETHKLNLRKREILFQKEIEAVSAFIALHRTIEPKYSHPDMDWDEAMTDVAEDFANIERKLRNYVAEYGAALSQQNRIEIDTCMVLASNHKFADREGRTAIDKARVTAAERDVENGYRFPVKMENSQQ